MRGIPVSSSVCARTTSTPSTAVRALWAINWASVTMTITISAATKTTTRPSARPTYQPEDAAREIPMCATPPSSLLGNPPLWNLPCQLRSRANLMDAPVRCGQAAALAAVSHGDQLGHDRHRRLLRGDASEVQPDRRSDALELCVADAGGDQALAPLRLRAATAHGADVGG